MTDLFLTTLLPQLASGAAHTHALGFQYEGLDGDRVRLRVPYRDDLVGDPETGVLAGGLVTTLLDHVGGLAVWVGLKAYQPIATLDLRVDYMRAAVPGRDLIAEARCYRLTRSIGFVRAWAFEDDPADPVAAAQAAYVISAEGDHRTGANLRASASRAAGDAA
ncbi:PaaI family thioesterase [Brevundimonas sp. NPDC090276]|uniref:PaaI family thioesterase n=1 Tax=Brevundimonas sp. NPDC090276 TaxID=3363956 RepID=UPI00383A8618